MTSFRPRKLSRCSIGSSAPFCARNHCPRVFGESRGLHIRLYVHVFRSFCLRISCLHFCLVHLQVSASGLAQSALPRPLVIFTAMLMLSAGSTSARELILEISTTGVDRGQPANPGVGRKCGQASRRGPAQEAAFGCERRRFPGGLKVLTNSKFLKPYKPTSEGARHFLLNRSQEAAETEAGIFDHVSVATWGYGKPLDSRGSVRNRSCIPQACRLV